MKSRIILTTLALSAIASMPLAAQRTSQPSKHRHSINISQWKPDAATSVTIASPKWGQTITGETYVQVSLKVGNKLDASSVKLKLNGKRVAAGLHQQNCSGAACTFNVNVSSVDGLRTGSNRMLARAHNGKRMSMDMVRFDYQEGSLTDTRATQYVPDSVGFQLSSGGADPWITINTGYQTADPAADASPLALSTAYPNMTISSGCADSQWQVVELDRLTPTQVIAKTCYGSTASMQNYLHGLASSANGREIVAVGNGWGWGPDAGVLNTTDIGGTDYTNLSADLYPAGYDIIGVPGAPAGSAYESYYTKADTNPAWPVADGLLVADGGAGNYNFVPGGPATFSVQSTAERAWVTLHYSGTDHPYGSPQQPNSPNGMWLLLLNRDTLNPVDYGPLCPARGSLCGTFYPTGSSDAGIANTAATALSSALTAVTPRQMIILTAVGQAFFSVAPANILKHAVDNLGGAGYTLATLTGSSTSYALVSHGFTTGTSATDCANKPECVVLPPATNPDNSFATPYNGVTGLNPFSQGVALSTTALADKGQTGFLSGVMNRDTRGLFYVNIASQEDAKLQAKYGAPTVNFDYHLMLGQSPTNWPDTDTPGHYAAYHYISNVYLKAYWGYSGSHASDVRYYYDSLSMNVGQYAGQIPVVLPATGNFAYPGDGRGFTLDDYNQVLGDLHDELMAVNNTFLYMGPNGMGQIVQGGTADLATTIIDAASQLTDGQIMDADPQISVVSNPTNWLGLASGVTNVGAAIGGVVFPPAGVALGVVSGALGMASSVGWNNGDQSVTYPTPASYQNGFDTTLAQISSNADSIRSQLYSSYTNSVSIITADAGKLNALGAKLQDTDSGWAAPSSQTITTAKQAISDGIKRSLYLQVLPQMYWLDTFKRVNATDPSMVNRTYVQGNPDNNGHQPVYCRSVYTGSDAEDNDWGWGGFISATPSANYSMRDFFVIGGRIDYMHTNMVVEAFPSGLLLSTLFTSGGSSTDYSNRNLNLPQYLLEADTNFLQLRPGKIGSPDTESGVLGALAGIGSKENWCYNPGCNGNTKDNACKWQPLN